MVMEHSVRFLTDISAVDEEGKTTLMTACGSGDVSKVEVLLSTFTDKKLKRQYVNRLDMSGRTALYYSAGAGHLDIMRLLIKSDADVSVSDQDGFTVLMTAACCGRTSALKILLESFTVKDLRLEYLNRIDNRRRTALFYASMYGHCDVMNVLINEGSDSSVHDVEGWSLLMASAAYDKMAAVRLLLSLSDELRRHEYLNERDRHGHMVLYHACLSGNLEMVRLILAAGADILARDGDNRTLLMDVAHSGEALMVQRLVAAIADEELRVEFVNTRDRHGRIALYIASEKGHIAAMQVLFTAGADVSVLDYYGETVLMAASESGNHYAVNLVLSQITNGPLRRECMIMQDKLDRRALLFEGIEELSAAIQALSAAGADASVLDAFEDVLSRSASKSRSLLSVNLHHAEATNEATRLEYVNARDRHGRSALYRASKYGHIAVMKVLFDAGVDVSVVDSNGDTVLMAAAKSGNHNAVELVLLKFNDEAERVKYVNARDKFGRSALFYASIKGHTVAMEVLLTAGADVAVRDNYGVNLLMAASESGNHYAVNLILALTTNVLLKLEDVDRCGRTALHHASKNGHDFTMQVLLDVGANKLAVDNSCGTVLMAASASGNISSVNLILSRFRSKALRLEYVNAQDSLGRSSLYHACENEHTAMMKVLFDEGATVSFLDDNSDTLLMAASKLGNRDAAELILSKFTDDALRLKYVNAQDSYRRSALYFASENGHTSVMKILLAEGADVSMLYNFDETVLTLASRSGNSDAVELVLSQFTYDALRLKYVNARDTLGRSAIHYASISGHTAVMNILLAAGADVSVINFRRETVLMAALESGNHHALELILSQFADNAVRQKYVNARDEDGHSALYYVSKDGRTAMMKVLLAAGADVSMLYKYNMTLLMVTTESCDQDSVKLVLSQFTDDTLRHKYVNIRDSLGRSALYYACKTGDIAVMQALFSAGADASLLDNRRKSVLMSAAELDSHCALELVLSQYTDEALRMEYVNVQNIMGWSALHYATNKGNFAAMETLLDAGADISRIDRRRRTVLMAASESRNPSAVALILSQFTDDAPRFEYVNAQDDMGLSALYYACNKGYTVSMQILLAVGADVAVVTNRRKTVLMAVSDLGRLDAVDLVLSQFTDEALKLEYVNVIDRDGHSALYYASEQGHVEVADALIEAGADVSMLYET